MYKFVEPTKDNKTFLENVVYFVDATSHETQTFWEEYCNNRVGFTWEQVNPGSYAQIGSLENRPVCISLFKVRILGHLVCFYEMTSQVQDSKMADDWLNLASEEYRKPRRSTDSSNFHDAVQHILDLREENIADYPMIWDSIRKKIVTPLPPRRTASSQTFKAVTDTTSIEEGNRG